MKCSFHCTFFAKAFYIGQGEAQPYPLELRATGAAVLSQVEHSAFTTLFLGI